MRVRVGGGEEGRGKELGAAERGGARRRSGEEEAEQGMDVRQGGGGVEKVRACKGRGVAARACSTQSSTRPFVPRVRECGRGVGVGVGRAASSHSRRDLRISVKGVSESIDHAAISLEGYPQTGAGWCDTLTIIIIAGY